jgi:hypothetical protein
MPDPVATPPAQQTPPAEPAKQTETPKPADTPPPKPADTPPPKPGDQPPPKTEQKPAEQTPEQKAAADKARDEQGRFVAAELKVPEGVKVDEKLMEQFKSLAPAIGISTKQAQALLEMQVKATQEQARQIDEAMQKQRVADLEALKGDKDFGGAKFDQTRAQVRSILEKTKYGPAVSKKLEAYGLDCDPDFTRFLAEVRSFIAEDSTSSRLTNPSPANGTQPMSQIDRQAATYKNQPRK